MSVHDAAELVGSCFEGHADAGFSEKLGGVRADDVAAEDLTVLGVGDPLHKPNAVVDGLRLTERAEGELACGELPTARRTTCGR